MKKIVNKHSDSRMTSTALNRHNKSYPLGQIAKNIETVGLCVLVFSLPALESPKWIGFALYMLGIIIRLFEAMIINPHNQGENNCHCKNMTWMKEIKISGFEIILLLMCATAILSSIINWPLPRGIASVKGYFLCILMGEAIYRQPYDQKRMNWVLGSLFAGIIVGLSWSWWDYLTLQNRYLEYQSIPNLNRSVIFHAIATFLMLAVVIDGKCQFNRNFRYFAAFCLLLSIPSLIAMGSRGGLLGFVAALIALTLFSLKNKKLLFSIFVALSTSVVLLVFSAHVFDLKPVKDRAQKFAIYYEFLTGKRTVDQVITNSDKVRLDYIRTAWAQISQTGHFYFGSGPSTYGVIDVESLSFNPPLQMYKKIWAKPTHAHNGFLTLWVEQGLIGVLCYSFLLGFIFYKVVIYRPEGSIYHYGWVAGVGAITIAAVSGLFNSVFTNETGWLFMFATGNFIRLADAKSSYLQSN